MKYKFLTVLFLFFACQDNVIKKPKNLISENDMEAIMYDMTLINAIKSNYSYTLSTYNIQINDYIYKKYNIDSLTLVENNLYYASKLDVYERMTKNVKSKFLNQSTEIDCLLTKSISEKKKKIMNDSLTINKN